MSDAEVLATLAAPQFSGGNAEHARRFMRDAGPMPWMLSRSRLNRRLHAVADLAYGLFRQLGSASRLSPGHRAAYGTGLRLGHDRSHELCHCRRG